MTGKESRKQKKNLEHLECSHQPHIQGRGAEERTQRAVNFNGWPRGCGAPNRYPYSPKSYHVWNNNQQKSKAFTDLFVYLFIV